MFLGLRDLVPAAGEGYVSKLARTHRRHLVVSGAARWRQAEISS